MLIEISQREAYDLWGEDWCHEHSGCIPPDYESWVKLMTTFSIQSWEIGLEPTP